MKVYLLCETATDYLEIYEYVTILGVYSSKKQAKEAAKKLDVEYTIIVKEVDREVSMHK